MNNGESMVVQSRNSISPVMDTLRVFTTRKKNCYTIEATKGEKVLVRASFHYGNYDEKSSPPSFDLQFDGNYWTTVETTLSNTEYVYYEVIYVVKGDSTSVCLAQTKSGQFPFISALEVRSLLPSMYSNFDQYYPLNLIRRIAYGTTESVGYADDPYDRIWTPSVGSGFTNISSDTSLIATDVWDQPPAAVLQNAVTASSASDSIRLVTGLLHPVGVPIYVNMYFNEMSELNSNEMRSFDVLVDNKPLLDQPITPVYANCIEAYANLTASSNTTFVLVPTTTSTLPPLINALEVYAILDVMTDGTDSNDVKGLATLLSAFDVLQDWGGDPCLPATYSWDWITCSSDPTPRVTALYLSSFGLSGPLPDFSSMDALETIDFHNNTLNGPVPDFLATLPKLKPLNLASNQFSGPIPSALSNKNGLNLVVTGNPDVCASGKSCTTTTTTNSPGKDSPGKGSPSGSKTKKKKSKAPVIVGTVVPAFILIWIGLGTKLILNHRRKTAAVAASGQGGANTPQSSSPINVQMIGKMGKGFMDEIKINMQDDQASTVDNSDDQINQQSNGNNSVG